MKCYCPACLLTKLCAWLRVKCRKNYGTPFKYGICRDTKIGDILPPESAGIVECATIELNRFGFTIAHITYVPKDNSK